MAEKELTPFEEFLDSQGNALYAGVGAFGVGTLPLMAIKKKDSKGFLEDFAASSQVLQQS